MKTITPLCDREALIVLKLKKKLWNHSLVAIVVAWWTAYGFIVAWYWKTIQCIFTLLDAFFREQIKGFCIINCNPFFEVWDLWWPKNNFLRPGIFMIHAKRMKDKSRACYILMCLRFRYETQIYLQLLWACYINGKTLNSFHILQANSSLCLLKFLQSGYFKLIHSLRFAIGNQASGLVLKFF